MGTKTTVNGQTVVHKDSGGVLNTTDVCNTLVGIVVVPIPYGNTALSEDTDKGSKTVFVDGNPIMLKDSEFSKSTGDEPGCIGGVMSGTTEGIAKFTNYSFDVMVEGRNVCRRLDTMTSNCENTGTGTLQQDNVEGEDKGVYTKSLAFVFKHPSIATQKTLMPLIDALHTVEGPETFQQESPGYSSVFHTTDQDGDYNLRFKEFNREEKKFE